MNQMITIAVEENVVRDVEKLYHELGLDVDTAVNMLFRQSLIQQGLPFQPKIMHKHTPLRDRLQHHDVSDYRASEWDTGESVGREVL